jgi:hypothetical protein
VVPEGEGTAVLHTVGNHPPSECDLKVKTLQFFTLFGTIHPVFLKVKALQFFTLLGTIHPVSGS